MLIFRPNQGSSVAKYVNITLNRVVTTTAQASSALDVVTYGQAVDTANLYANKTNETFNTPITVANPVNNTDTVTRKFLFDTIFAVTKANVAPILDQYPNNNGGIFTGPISRDSDPYNLNNAPSNDNTAITNKFANDKLKQAVSAVSADNAVAAGQIYEIYGASTPDGYLKCNGAAVSKSDYSNLYNAIGDQYTSQFKESAGVPWQSQYGFNPSRQNEISGWSEVTKWDGTKENLKYYTYGSASLVTKDYMYILGGNNNNGGNTIQAASLYVNGGLSSVWNDAGTLPVAMQHMGYLATKDRFYLIGGSDGSNALSSVYSAPIIAYGALGSFRKETPLPDARDNVVSFVIKNKIYAIGSKNSIVYRTTVNEDGTLSSWETLSNFPINFNNRPIPLLIKDRIYIIGANDGANYESKIYYGIYDSDGIIKTWTYVSNMPNNIYGSAVVCNANYVFNIGGYDQDNNKYSTALYRAPILADGSIGDWIKVNEDSNIGIADAQVAISGNNIYLIGGHASSTGLNTVYTTYFRSGIADYTPYYTYQPNTSSTFNLPDLPSMLCSAYYIKT